MENKNSPITAITMPESSDGSITTYFGLTKREYLAAKAMQGLLSNPEWMNKYETEKYLMSSDIIADISIKISDKLLKQLEK